MITLAAVTFALASSTFKPNATMPSSTEYNQSGCNGANISPELHWSGAPKNTRSFALIVHDPDAPAPGGWYHWVVYNIPASTHNLVAGAKLRARQLGKTSWNELGYGGPCPPPGAPHHYNFTLYALDTPVLVLDRATGAQLEAAIAKHSIGRARITGLFGR
jgi:Raf kinase inhibitor-like YbhB/YbcL family protein